MCQAHALLKFSVSCVVFLWLPLLLLFLKHYSVLIWSGNIFLHRRNSACKSHTCTLQTHPVFVFDFPQVLTHKDCLLNVDTDSYSYMLIFRHRCNRYTHNCPLPPITFINNPRFAVICTLKCFETHSLTDGLSHWLNIEWVFVVNRVCVCLSVWVCSFDMVMNDPSVVSWPAYNVWPPQTRFHLINVNLYRTHRQFNPSGQKHRPCPKLPPKSFVKCI